MSNSTTGHIRQGAGAAIAALRARAVEWELEAAETGGTLILPLWGGELRADPADSGLRLTIRAPERRLVQVIRDAASELLAGEGIAVVWDAVETGALAPGLSLMRVAGVTHRSPGFLRVRLRGDEAARFATGGLHFRLLLPPAGRVPVWPRIAATGRTVWPEGADALHRPVYTVAAQDEDWLDFDIWRHAGSPTCDWAETVAQGAEVGIIGPGGGWCPEARQVMLFGDETALPAVARMLDLAPGRVMAHVSVAEHDLCGLRAERVPDLVAALERAEIAPGTHVWFAAREDQARAARALLTARGLGKKDFTAAAYWS
ncbi:MAG: siderophore-interacting protein [Paracoccaceae bacterium]